MYLLITEDGDIFCAPEYHKDDPMMADAGLIDLIDVSCDEPKQYINGEWKDIRVVDYSTYQD